MYTRCPSCSSTFRVTPAVLQMADGEVRCGSCSAVFNALHTLVDDWSGADFALPGAPRLTHPDAPPPVETPAPPEKSTPAVPETLEFNVPENEWQRFFIAAEEAPLPRPDPGLGEDFVADENLEQHALPRSLEEETADTDTWQAFLRETEPDAETDDEPFYVIGEDAARADQIEVLIRRAPGAQVSAAPLAAASGLEHDEPAVGFAGPAAEPGSSPPASADEQAPEPLPAAETVLDWGPPPAFPERAPRPPPHTGRWLAAGAVAALVLAGQALHSVRDALAADPNYGPQVRDLYARLGWPLYPAWPLDSYDIRDTKAIAEKSGPGALDIVAEIAVTGRQPVGLPMVRVVLRDRWSNAVASGVFDSAHYLAEAPAPSQTYAPGTLIPVEISLKDPGAAAQGYELDVCVPNRKSGLQCKTALDPFRK